MSKQDNTLEVWLDDPGSAGRVGTFAHDRGQIRFHYELGWLKNPREASWKPSLAVNGCRDAACRPTIAAVDMELTATAFSAHATYRNAANEKGSR